jgi:hypothetical protein
VLLQPPAGAPRPPRALRRLLLSPRPRRRRIEGRPKPCATRVTRITQKVRKRIKSRPGTVRRFRPPPPLRPRGTRPAPSRR